MYFFCFLLQLNLLILILIRDTLQGVKIIIHDIIKAVHFRMLQLNLFRFFYSMQQWCPREEALRILVSVSFGSEPVDSRHRVLHDNLWHDASQPYSQNGKQSCPRVQILCLLYFILALDHAIWCKH